MSNKSVDVTGGFAPEGKRSPERIPRDTGGLELAEVQPTRKSGRVAFDDNGSSIWEWQTATGVFERNITEGQLQRLEAAHLRVVEQPALAQSYQGQWIYECDRSPAASARAAHGVQRHVAAPAQAVQKHESVGLVRQFLRRLAR